jgi:hypothetical protein
METATPTVENHPMGQPLITVSWYPNPMEEATTTPTPTTSSQTLSDIRCATRIKAF